MRNAGGDNLVQPYRRLKAEMIMKDIKYKEMADLLDIAIPTFSNKINRANGNDFKPDEIKKICDKYDIGIDIFFGN